jgi:photosystem II stability/assembly factor-like uncharacterized protein
MTQPHRLYVGTIGQGVWRSSDSGETFRRASDGMFVECHVRALAVHPHNPRTLYAGTEQGLFRTTDGADNWTRVESPLNGLQIWSLLLVPHAPDVILAGTCPSRIFRSPDGGRSWTEPAVRLPQDCPRIIYTRMTTLIADPTEPQAIWAGVEIGGLYRSRDGGQTWQAAGHGLSSLDIHGMAIVPGNGRPKRLVASTNNDLNLSTDDGETWRPLRISEVLPWSYCRGIAQLSNRPEVLLLGNGEGPPGSAGVVARSADAGVTWEAARMPSRANSTLWNFAVHPADPDLVYASSVSGEIYRSTDGGVSWHKLTREFGEIRALAWTP